MNVGYYIFLGRGDYHSAESINKIWSFNWELNDWKIFIDELCSLESNTLMIYLNGHLLPYESTKYPELIDIKHKNAMTDLLYQVFEYAKNKGLKIIPVVTTTGHCGGFTELHNESMIEPFGNIENLESQLVSFPSHLRTGKTEKKEGAAQVGYGVACHNKEISRQYAVNIIEELLVKYGMFFDGIALHPPESVRPCFCERCCSMYYENTGTHLKTESAIIARKFFIISYLKFQKEVLMHQIGLVYPSLNILIFTIPWLFESVFADLAYYIPSKVTLIDWDYNLEESRVNSLNLRINLYQSQGNKVWFMPSAGFSFNETSSSEEQVLAVYQQMDIAEEEGVEGIVHFLGPKVSPFLMETSRKSKKLCFLTHKINKFV